MRCPSFRLIGPNCMGIYCPRTGMAFRPDFPREPGSIGFVSQSGGMTIPGVHLGAARALRFSKVVSFGNEVDLSSVGLLEHLAGDPETDLVGESNPRCAFEERFVAERVPVFPSMRRALDGLHHRGRYWRWRGSLTPHR